MDNIGAEDRREGSQYVSDDPHPRSGQLTRKQTSRLIKGQDPDKDPERHGNRILRGMAVLAAIITGGIFTYHFGKHTIPFIQIHGILVPLAIIAALLVSLIAVTLFIYCLGYMTEDWFPFPPEDPDDS